MSNPNDQSRQDRRVVLCETRPSDLVGVKLLLASLARHLPGTPVDCYLSAPLAAHGATLAPLNRAARLVPYAGPSDWSCKPTVLLDALDRSPGARLMWLDTDMLLLRPIDDAHWPADPAVLVAAEECNPNPNVAVPDRQRAIGVPAAVPQALTFSSCIIGASPAHRDLLAVWRDAMAQPLFQGEQALPAHQRRVFRGDQEVWEAIVASAMARGVPVHALRNGVDVLHATYTGYVRTRAYARSDRRRRPWVVHAIGDLKPWRAARSRAAQEIFPYFRAARAYRHALSTTERAAFRRRSVGALLGLLGGYGLYQAARQRRSFAREWSHL